jgi:hypothetical protein
MSVPDWRSSRLKWWGIVAAVLIVQAICCAGVWRAQMISDVGPTWRGITVGQSAIDDVTTTLDAPTHIEHKLRRMIYSYQEGRFEWGMHRIVIRDGVVEYIEEDALAYSYDIGLTQLIDQYGIPDHVMWSREGPELRIVIFLNHGVFVSTTAIPLDEARVTRIFYYQPRSLVRLLVDFSEEISPVNPFPRSDIVGPRDPWFETP